jgi:hypothetical protein
MEGHTDSQVRADGLQTKILTPNHRTGFQKDLGSI